MLVMWVARVVCSCWTWGGAGGPPWVFSESLASSQAVVKLVPSTLMGKARMSRPGRACDQGCIYLRGSGGDASGTCAPIRCRARPG